MSRFRTIAAALAFLAAMATSSAVVAQGCASGGEARQLIQQGQIVPLAVALQRAGLGDVQVADAKLCSQGGGWFYQVRYRYGGQVSVVSLPAGGGY
jgi:hypothetical protein